MTLEWLKPTRTGEGTAQQLSACGRYRIDRVESQASVGYTSWRKSCVPGVLNKRLGATEALCEDDKSAEIVGDKHGSAK